MGVPDFICMGFQKCGTTTLFEILNQHPQIALTRDVKEPMYYRVPVFSTLLRGKKFYDFRYFGHIKPGDPRITGEVNAGLGFGGCAKKLSRDFDSDTKMIFMMRNPVDRSYSAYKYFLARGFLPANAVRYDEDHGHAAGFDYYVHQVLDDPRQKSKVMDKRFKYLVLSQSNYATCIKEYLDTFSLENMKFVIFEEFVRDQHKACREIYDFLGIDDCDDVDHSVVANEGKERAVTPFRAKLMQIFKGCEHFFYDFCAMPHWAPKLYGLFRRLYDFARSRCIVPDADTSKVLPGTRAYLLDYFKDEIAEIEKLTGRNLMAVWAEDRGCPEEERGMISQPREEESVIATLSLWRRRVAS